MVPQMALARTMYEPLVLQSRLILRGCLVTARKPSCCYLVVGMEHSQHPICHPYCCCSPRRQHRPAAENGRSKGRQFPIPAAHIDVSVIDPFGGMAMSNCVRAVKVITDFLLAKNFIQSASMHILN